MHVEQFEIMIRLVIFLDTRSQLPGTKGQWVLLVQCCHNKGPGDCRSETPLKALRGCPRDFADKK